MLPEIANWDLVGISNWVCPNIGKHGGKKCDHSGKFDRDHGFNNLGDFGVLRWQKGRKVQVSPRRSSTFPLDYSRLPIMLIC